MLPCKDTHTHTQVGTCKHTLSVCWKAHLTHMHSNIEPTAGCRVYNLTTNCKWRNTSGAQIRWSWQRWKMKQRPSMMSLCFVFSPPLSLSPSGYHLLFLPCLSFLDIIAFLLVFVPFSLPHSLSLPLPHTVTPTHSHINTELSLAYRDSLLLWSKAFIWWLGLKNGHLLLPLINSACVCECVCYWICCLLGFFGKYIYRKCILCCRMSVFKCVLKRQIVKARNEKQQRSCVTVEAVTITWTDDGQDSLTPQREWTANKNYYFYLPRDLILEPEKGQT